MLPQDYKSTFCEHFLIFIFKEKTSVYTDIPACKSIPWCNPGKQSLCALWQQSCERCSDVCRGAVRHSPKLWLRVQPAGSGIGTTGGKEKQSKYAHKDKASGGKPERLGRKTSRGQEGLERAHIPPCATAPGQLSTNAELTEGVQSRVRDRCCCSTAPPLPHNWKERAWGWYITPSHIPTEAGARNALFLSSCCSVLL